MKKAFKLDLNEIAVLLSRSISIVIGPLSAMAVASYFSPVTQGYYFSFISILGAQIIFESGMGTVILQMVAHGKEASSKNRLASLYRFARRWYLALAILMTIAVGMIGWISFSSAGDNVDWKFAWILLVLIAGIDFCFQPVFFFLEGLGRIRLVYRYRAIRAIVYGVCLVCFVLNGFELYALPAALAGGLLVGITFVLLVRKELPTFSNSEKVEEVNWRTEILPFQWKVAVTWISGYLTVSLFAPILLFQQGAEAAGRIGLTVTIFNSCTALSASFMQAHFPTMGSLAAQAKYLELHQLFKSKAILSTCVAFFLICFVLSGVLILDGFDFSIANRVVDVAAMALLASGYMFYHFEGVLAYFSRAQKVEPYFSLEIFSGTLILCSTYYLGGRFGELGVAAGFVAVHGLFTLPRAIFIYRRNRAFLFSGNPAKS